MNFAAVNALGLLLIACVGICGYLFYRLIESCCCEEKSYRNTVDIKFSTMKKKIKEEFTEKIQRDLQMTFQK